MKDRSKLDPGIMSKNLSPVHQSVNPVKITMARHFSAPQLISHRHLSVFEGRLQLNTDHGRTFVWSGLAAFKRLTQ
ncbi:hypothetical protein T265_09772 [Opisthorchis viverrini]|uniref:Uncharacterized protein n=1 Tax=Opisthorchis viverrini TaxID=6198 RepID=A0A074Z4M5_OPIVI|nr:hypothetical protein T265_09772 [Opisthorchis viverrini]KER22018.1 hypothetical protein T265_09772 [Opisthorchis viverrini]